jgi:hypothetical protein
MLLISLVTTLSFTRVLVYPSAVVSRRGACAHPTHIVERESLMAQKPSALVDFQAGILLIFLLRFSSFIRDGKRHDENLVLCNALQKELF